ncbi:MAG: hypothetical protein GY822_27020 [Deltaproteobacteria bacterium]|nr:hypothetical protein [Deltaproteobacteria bacterium]
MGFCIHRFHFFVVVFAEICQHGTQETSRQEGRPEASQAFPPQVRQEGGTQAQTPSLCQEG